MNLRRGIYIFVGPPGAGKGSLSRWCVQELGFVQVSTGDLCRKHIAEKTSIGKGIDFAIKSGKLVSDSLITSMVGEWLREFVQKPLTLIFDGYPRTAQQARDLDQLLKDIGGVGQPRVIRLQLSDDAILVRLGQRYVCTGISCQAVYSLVENSELAPRSGMICDRCGEKVGRRGDDVSEAVAERLDTYHKHKGALLSACKDLGWMVIELDVERPLGEVFQSFRKIAGAGCP